MSRLIVDGLTVTLGTLSGPRTVVREVGLTLGEGETLGLVGESGSGKSLLWLGVLGLVPPGAVVTGSARLGDTELVGAGQGQLADIRGRRIAMVFQDPMTALNPYLTIGRQLAEVVERHHGADRSTARRAALDLLDRVGIPDAARRIDLYPHEFSGGMRQRATIAMALLGRPDILVADEPTTALDVTVQAQILDLFAELKRDGGLTQVLISHDLGVVAGLADRVAVMYAGRLVEVAGVEDLFACPLHPYTQGLLAAMPRVDRPGVDLLATIPGQPPDPARLPPGCAFAPRCLLADDGCRHAPPVLAPVAPGRQVACRKVGAP
ncbi:MAG: ABC transporter ATP-binding protein [Alphaproteobacteria bacterium]|jgi:oligopeptide/dipeptide ABC transporter ATP-binding protein|nr:ABC transporter ATP-binding protein [Alphaproteobacteria bacterium]